MIVIASAGGNRPYATTRRTKHLLPFPKKDSSPCPILAQQHVVDFCRVWPPPEPQASCCRRPIERSAIQSPNDRPVFATIGLRNQGWAITQKTFKFADFAALADVDSKVLGTNVEKTEQKQGKKPDAYKDYRQVLDRKDIDAVMIATPDHWHTKIAVEAMRAGKDVYCEKPLTLTVDEGKLIEKVVKETGRVFQVGTMQRTECGHHFLQAIALVKQGRIGTVKKVTCGIGGM